jgi:endonuclease V-like protein UPF0215 family
MHTIEVERIGREEMKAVDGLPMIVVYEKPTDFPEMFVARLFDIQAGAHRATEIAAMAETYGEVIEKIPWNDMFCIKRMLDDDPCIVESWI